jgi:hypothetical protein
MPLRRRSELGLPPPVAEGGSPANDPGRAQRVGRLRGTGRLPADVQPDPATGESFAIPAAVTAGVVGAAALAARNPAVLGRVARGVQDLRILSMLSGLAPAKSVLGNVGATVYSGIERGSLAPLRELFSPKTARDAVQAFRQGAQSATVPSSGTVIAKANIPGRVMGALDQATRGALMRAGLSSDEAAREVLQAPLGKNRFTQALASPVGQYLVPFQRTPFNTLIEGLETLRPENLQTIGQKAALGTSIASGAATGAAAEDPRTIALGTAFSGRRGLPFAASAAATRYLQGASKRDASEVLQGISPVSDYSLSQGLLAPVTDPLHAIAPKPAAIPAFAYIRSLLGLK